MNTLWHTRSGALLVSWILASACGSDPGDGSTAAGPDTSSSSGGDSTGSTSEDGQTESSSGGTESTGDTSSSSGGDDSSSGSGSGSGSESDSTDTEPVAGCPDIPLENIGGTLAIARADLPDSGGDTSDDGVGTGEEPDPDDLFLLIDSNDAITCDDPRGSSECVESWGATIVIPLAAQTPGVYELGVDVQGYHEVTFENRGECGGGGGSLEGTLEIIAIDATQVSARLCNTNLRDVPANGSFEAARCE